MNEPVQPAPVAIIGMGCLFPKADNLGAYWSNICKCVDAITDVPATHWRPEDYLDADPKSPDRVYAARGGFLSPVAFQPLEFGISPNTLEAIDTTQLLGLMVAKQALDDAGYGSSRAFDRNRVSVILGVTGTLELVIPLGARLGHPIWRKALQEAGVAGEVANDVVQRIADSYVGWQEDSFPGLLGNVAAGRIANRLDLCGTNCVVDAACASSLAALHLGMLELQAGRADMVLSGGLDTFNDVFMYMCFSKTPALSPTGSAKPFDSQADGTILGEGLGCILLKRHADAVRDGDKIYAVIRGLGTSSDGKGNAIYAPSAAGQEKALRQAYRTAGISPDTIELIEAHGTGTRAGDTAEATALAEVYRATRRQGSWCAIGSVKSQIGHTKAAAGVAGLIKAALALHHKVLPPTIKVERPADVLAPGESPFYVNAEERPWLPPSNHARRAAVSSFGFGGSNYHCVLEEAGPAKTETAWDEGLQILAYAGPTRQHLLTQLAGISPETSWDDLKREAERSRASFFHAAPCRLVSIVERSQPLAGNLAKARALLDGGTTTANKNEPVYFGEDAALGGLAFLFPGQGSQYVGMLRDWACRFPLVHQTLCDADSPIGEGKRLTDYIYPQTAYTEDDRTQNEEALRSTNVAQPALGAVGLGAARLLEYFGVSPAAVAGHSYGELVALHAAGVFDSKTLHALSRLRGRLMDAVAGDQGAMLAVLAPLTDVEAVLRSEALDLTIANRNAPRQFVLSGRRSEIARAEAAFAQRKVACRLLPVAAAFHSPLVAEVQQPFRDTLEEIHFHAPTVPVYANTTAQPYPAEPSQMRALLAEQLARPVAFVDAIEAMCRDGVRTFVEVGPGSKLGGLVRSILEGRPHAVLAVDSSMGKRSACYDLACVLGELAVLGYEIAWSRWHAGPKAETDRIAKKPALTVPLCGSNYVKPRLPRERRAARNPSLPPANGDSSVPIVTGEDQAMRNGTNGEAQSLSHPVKEREDQQRAVEAGQKVQTTPVEAASYAQALRITQENLLALQKLGEQTADLHRQFLEGQDKVLQAFQKVLEQQQSLIHASAGGAPPPVLPPTASTGPSVPIEPARVAGVARSATPVSDDRGFTSFSPGHPSSVPITSPIPGALATTVLEVVAEKTGYPPEMLELGMELDADLGIDSIKRVEIFSALQERLPAAPVVKPEHVGTLRTLQNVLDFLARSHKGERLESPASADPLQSPTVPGVQSESFQEDIAQMLLAVVSEKTGYPIEMLELDMEVDSDLGIDSIKRVEIFSTIQEKLPEAPVIKPEDVGSLRTLRHIADFLAKPTATRPRPGTAKKTAIVTDVPAPGPTDVPVERLVLCSRPLDESLNRGTIPLGPGEIWVTDDDSGLAECLAGRLGMLGREVRRIPIGAQHALPRPSTLAGLIIVSPLEPDDAFLRDALSLVQFASTGLRRSGEEGGAVLATVSRLDGHFGLRRAEHVTGGGLAGLTKTAGQEWPEVQCKALDLDADFADVETAAGAVMEEVFRSGEGEVGIHEHGKAQLRLEGAAAPEGDGVLPLAEGEVVLITGGARGVTAAVAIAIAGRVRPVLVLLGRNPLPAPEPAWLTGLTRESEIKRALVQQAGKPLTPKDVAEQYGQLSAQREIRGNLEKMSAAGATVVYRSVDVRDAAAVRALVEDVRASFGPIRGLIHGAGVLADRRIEDKTVEQFDRVYQTKVHGLRHLLRELDSDPLKVLVVFSSSTGRFGRSGQVDYAMANEVLNKLAQREARRRPDCKVVAVNWGPWDGGMVSAGLRNIFAEQGIGLIPLHVGADYLLREISHASRAAEVVVMAKASHPEPELADSAGAAAPPGADTAHSPLAVGLERDVRIDDYVVLRSHVLQGKAVVPLALAIEWLAHSALHGNPGLSFHGFNELCVLKGIRLDADEAVRVRFFAAKAARQGDAFLAAAELRGLDDGKEIVFSRAEIALTDRLPTPPISELFESSQGGAYPRSAAEVYEELLFHGPALRGIQRICSCDARGIVADAAAAPAPSAWFRQPLRSHWLTDPLVLDVAFQLGVVWAQERLGVPALPTRVRRYRQYRKSFPREGVRIVIAVKLSNEHRLLADAEFLDREGVVVARIEECEWVCDRSLVEAYSERTLAGASVSSTVQA